MLIGEEAVVNNDGLHGSKQVEGRVALQKGFHPLTVEYFQRTGGRELELFYKGPSITQQTMPSDVLFHKLKD